MQLPPSFVFEGHLVDAFLTLLRDRFDGQAATVARVTTWRSSLRQGWPAYRAIKADTPALNLLIAKAEVLVHRRYTLYSSLSRGNRPRVVEYLVADEPFDDDSRSEAGDEDNAEDIDEANDESDDERQAVDGGGWSSHRR